MLWLKVHLVFSKQLGNMILIYAAILSAFLSMNHRSVRRPSICLPGSGPPFVAFDRRKKRAESDHAQVYASLGRTGALSFFFHSVSDSPDDDLPPGKAHRLGR
jgi:hypothetical protein